jgi:lysozyme family protein
LPRRSAFFLFPDAFGENFNKEDKYEEQAVFLGIYDWKDVIQNLYRLEVYNG